MVKMGRNHLKIDPSRTALIRRQYAADMQRRFTVLRKAVWHYIAVNNELGLTANAWSDAAREASIEARRRYGVSEDAEKWINGYVFGVEGVAAGSALNLPSDAVIRELKAFVPEKPIQLWRAAELDKRGRVVKRDVESWTKDKNFAKHLADVSDGKRVLVIGEHLPSAIVADFTKLPKSIQDEQTVDSQQEVVVARGQALKHMRAVRLSPTTNVWSDAAREASIEARRYVTRVNDRIAAEQAGHNAIAVSISKEARGHFKSLRLGRAANGGTKEDHAKTAATHAVNVHAGHLDDQTRQSIIEGVGGDLEGDGRTSPLAVRQYAETTRHVQLSNGDTGPVTVNPLSVREAPHAIVSMGDTPTNQIRRAQATRAARIAEQEKASLSAEHRAYVEHKQDAIESSLERHGRISDKIFAAAPITNVWSDAAREASAISRSTHAKRVVASLPQEGGVFGLTDKALVGMALKRQSIYADGKAKLKLQALAERAAKGNIWIRTSAISLKPIVELGRFKNQHEHKLGKVGGGFYDPQLRAKVEDKFFGTAAETSDSDRPIYGYLTNDEGGVFKGRGGDVLKNYGDVAVRLKDHVREVTTFTGGDSWNHNKSFDSSGVVQFLPSKVNLPSSASMHLSATSLSKTAPLEKATPDYFETQIHGGVKNSDIAEVVFHDKKTYTSDLKAVLDKAGIQHRLRGAPTINAPKKPFKFETDPAKLKRFQRWLKQRIDAGILEINPTTGEPLGMKPWMYKYVDSAYKKGLLRAYFDMYKKELGKPQAYYDGTKQQFLESSFGQGERVSKLELIYTRSYEDLKGVTAAMSTQLSRTLAEGLANGQHPLQTARTMVKTVDKLSKTRAKVIALTETIHAHAEGQLDGFEDLGVEEVGADVEFTDSGDDGVCPICKSLNGKTFTIAKARGVIPVHPRCRCSWSPVIKLPKGVKP